MKKGFTLIELLIVMVIVGVMVAVALPQYQRSMERGRAMEGLANVRAAAEQLAAYYLVHGGLPELNTFLSRDLLKNNDFAFPTVQPVAGETDRYTVRLDRKSGKGWSYWFIATFVPDGILKIECNDSSNGAGDCETLGFTTCTSSGGGTSSCTSDLY